MKRRNLQTNKTNGLRRRGLSLLLAASLVLSGTLPALAAEDGSRELIVEADSGIAETAPDGMETIPAGPENAAVPESTDPGNTVVPEAVSCGDAEIIPEGASEMTGPDTAAGTPEGMESGTAAGTPEMTGPDTAAGTPEMMEPDAAAGTPGTAESAPGTGAPEDILLGIEEITPTAMTLRDLVQNLIDELPDTVTEENAEEVRGKLSAIDQARAELTEEESETLDITKYISAVNAVLELEGMAGAGQAELLADGTTYDISAGSVIISADGDYTITGSAAVVANTITVKSGVSANITLSNVNIDVSGTEKAAAFKIEDNSAGNVTVILEGENTLKSGKYCAGLQKSGMSGSLTIQGSGSLTATGGDAGAGIGGGDLGAGSGITIRSGNVTAVGGSGGAGIGGGKDGIGDAITITGGTVVANGGKNSAGIGGGYSNKSSVDGSNITISGGHVTARGNSGGAGIGGGPDGSGSHITISGGTVEASTDGSGAGIGGGGGSGGDGINITIEGGTVKATGGSGAGIGGGYSGDGLNILISGGTVDARTDGSSSAGIGGGDGGSGTVIISGGIVTAKGGYYGSTADIGNGDAGTGGSFSTGDNGSAVIIAGSISDMSGTGNWSGLFFLEDGKEGQVYGSPVLTADIALPADAALIIPAGTTLTVSGGATLNVPGTVQGDGTLAAAGSITGNVDLSFGSLQVSGKLGGASYDAVNKKLIVGDGTKVTICMKDGAAVPGTDCIEVGAGTQADITLSGVNIDLGSSDSAAFRVLEGGSATVTLEGENTLKGGFRCAGMQVDGPSASLTIQGNGSLAVTGGGESAGIGGGYCYSNGYGNITILGGTINAVGGSGGAGIGGASNKGESGTITIQDGNITAAGDSGSGGAGIGSGAHGSASTIIINGGTVTATGGYSSAGIGAGWGTENDRITITGGTVTATGGSQGAGIGDGSGGTTSSVTITGGMVTAIGDGSSDSPGAGIGNGGYYMAGGLTGHGAFSTGDSGSAIIVASSISDQTGKESGNWSGIIFEGESGQVYGNMTLPQSFVIPEDKTLTIPAGASLTVLGGMTLTNNGTLTIGRGGSLAEDSAIDGSGAFLTENLTEDMITVSTVPAYDGTDLSARIQEQVVLEKSTICGREFQVSGWEPSVAKSADSEADYHVTCTHTDGSTLAKIVTVAQSGTRLTAQFADNKRDYAYADTITITAKVSPTGQVTRAAAANARLQGLTAPAPGQMAVYDANGSQISEPASPDAQGKCTFTIPAGTLGAGEHTLTVRFTESAVLAGAEIVLDAIQVAGCPHSDFTEAGVCKVCGIEATATVTVDGAPTYYIDFMSAWEAAKGTGDKAATITILKDVSVPGVLEADTGDNIILKASGEGITLTRSAALFAVMGDAAITFESGSYKAGGTCIDVDGGNVNMKGGTFTTTENGASALRVCGGTVTFSGGEFISDAGVSGNAITIDYPGLTVGSFLADGYVYHTSDGWFSVDDLNGTTTPSRVEVLPAPVKITKQPESPDPVEYGYTESPRISIEAESVNGGQVSYQWYEVNEKTAEKSLVSTGVDYAPAALEVGSYSCYCAVTCDGYTVNSNTVTITVTPCPHPDYVIGDGYGSSAECTQCGTSLEAAAGPADGTPKLYESVRDAWDAARAIEGTSRVEFLSSRCDADTSEGKFLKVRDGQTIQIVAGFESACIMGRIIVDEGGVLELGCPIVGLDAAYPVAEINGELRVDGTDGKQPVGLQNAYNGTCALKIGEKGVVTLQDCFVEGIQIDESNTQMGSVASMLGAGCAGMKFDEESNPVWLSAEDLAGKSYEGQLVVYHLPVKITGQPASPEPLEAGYAEAPRLTVATETTDLLLLPVEDYPTVWQWYQVSPTEGGNDILIQEEGSGCDTGTYTVPTGLEAGEYQYYCAVSRAGYTVKSEIVTVAVRRSFTIGVTSRLDGTEGTVAHVSGGGKVFEGEQTTVTATAVEGCTFNGWYNGDACVSTSLSYTFTPAESMTLTAVYTSNAKATVTVKGLNSARFTVGSSTTPQSACTEENVAIGSRLTITAVEPDKVSAWLNGSQKVIGTGASIEITVTGDMTIELMYKAADENQAMVEYVSDYGQLLSFKSYKADETITPPAAPSRLGYTFTGWNLSMADIQAKIAAGERHITVKPLYKATNQSFTVTVKYPDGRLADDIYTGTEGSGLTVTAKDIEGKTFANWTDESGRILSYGQSYFVQVTSDVTLTANYADSAVEAKPVIAMTAMYASVVDGSNKVSFAATRSVPEEYTVLEQGILYGIDSALAGESAMVLGGTSVKKAQSSNLNNNGIQTVNVSVGTNTGTTIYARGYMIIRNNLTNNLETIYSDIASGSFSGLSK